MPGPFLASGPGCDTRWPFMHRLLAFLTLLTGCEAGPASLRVFVGAGMKAPVDQLLQESPTGLPAATVTYGGSGVLLSQVALSGLGDVYLPGSMADLERADARGVVASSAVVAWHEPVIAVPAASERSVRCLEDLTQPDLRVGLCDPRACAIGHVAERLLGQAGLDTELGGNVAVRTTNVQELVMAASMEQLDAVVVWRTAAASAGGLVIVELPREQTHREAIPAAVLRSAQDPDAAQAFVDWLGSERGQAAFVAHGFLPAEAP